MQEIATRKGDWLLTYTGKQVYPLDPRPEEIDIIDIAHALSLTCRYNGHCKEFYSVAQHSVYVADICDSAYALHGLLHDATEAYIGDVIRPLKPYLTNYQDIEERLGEVIGQKFGYDPEEYYESVKWADDRILCSEGRDIMYKKINWSTTRHLKPTVFKILPVGPKIAEGLFLNKFGELYAKQQKRLRKKVSC